jgi:hypothetical protein
MYSVCDLSTTAFSSDPHHTTPVYPSTPTPAVTTPQTPKPLLPVPLASLLSRQWYGATYHTRIPRQWATQFLGLNLTRAYARHFHTSRARLSSSSTSPHPGFSAFPVFRYHSTVIVEYTRRPPRRRYCIA